MMTAMMLPSLAPTLWRYRQAAGSIGTARPDRLVALVGVGYFVVWAVFGLAAFTFEAAVTEAWMQQPALARAAPILTGVVVAVAGATQLSAWKARQLASCREMPGRGSSVPMDIGSALRYGLRLGLHCGASCVGPMAILLVVGVMDLRAMAVVTAAITAERLAPSGKRVAQATGAAAVAAGLLSIARAVGAG